MEFASNQTASRFVETDFSESGGDRDLIYGDERQGLYAGSPVARTLAGKKASLINSDLNRASPMAQVLVSP
jgi:hypothetical protein